MLVKASGIKPCEEAAESVGRYHLTSGSKFGADYLMYNEDPHRYHAAACVRITHPEAPLEPVLLAAAVRSALGARKVLLLAAVDDSTNAVEYMTVSQK